MPNSRSVLDEELYVVFRHPLMFSSDGVAPIYTDWDGENLEQYAGTDRDAGWVLRRGRSQEISVRIALIQQMRQIDWGTMVETYQKDPAKLVVQFLESQPVSRQTAELCGMTVRWYGPYFTVARSMKLSAKGIPIPDKPFTVEDFTGSGKASEKKQKHPLNAELMPIAPEWVDLIDDDVCDAASATLQLLRRRRPAAQQAGFSPRPPGVADPVGRPEDGGLPAENTDQEDDGA